MTNTWVHRVAAMRTTTGTERLNGQAVVEVYSRFTLLALAYSADRDGTCTINRGELSKITRIPDLALHRALVDLEQSGLVTVERAPSRPNRYTLDADAIASYVPKHIPIDPNDIAQLGRFDVGPRHLNPLRRKGISTLTALGALIDKFRAQTDFTEFNRYVDERGFGPNIAAHVLIAYDRWLTEKTDTERSTP